MVPNTLRIPSSLLVPIRISTSVLKSPDAIKSLAFPGKNGLETISLSGTAIHIKGPKLNKEKNVKQSPGSNLTLID